MSDDDFDRELARMRDDERARAMLLARVRRQSLLILTLTERIQDQDREIARLRDLLTVIQDTAARRLRTVRELSGDDRPTRMPDEGVVLGAMERLGLLRAGVPDAGADVATGRVTQVDALDALLAHLDELDEDEVRRQRMLELLDRMDAEDPATNAAGGFADYTSPGTDEIRAGERNDPDMAGNYDLSASTPNRFYARANPDADDAAFARAEVTYDDPMAARRVESGIDELLADLEREHGPISNEVREAVDCQWDEALRQAREGRTGAPRSGSSEAGRRAESERDEPDERNV